jgi:hypothetical protein
VLNMRMKSMQTVFFCTKHCPPVAFLNNVTDIFEIQENLDPTLEFARFQPIEH